MADGVQVEMHLPAITVSVATQAAALLGASTIVLVSTSAPALNGVYPFSQMFRDNVESLQTAISAGIGLPHGANTVPLVDTDGVDRQFTAAQITALAGAVLNYGFSLIRCAQGKLDALPSPVLTIP